MESLSIPEPRTPHDFFVTDYAPFRTTLTWRDWWSRQWEKHIDFYEKLKWKMIPITVRSKNPLKAHSNYESHAARGPYLDGNQARFWTMKQFNLAVAAAPSGIVWADMDKPELYHESLLRGLTMRTPRGFAIPLTADLVFTEERVQALKMKGYDFREDIMYELVPLSETCLMDSALGIRHGDPKKPCVSGFPHQYRIRTWLDMEKDILSFREFYEVVR